MIVSTASFVLILTLLSGQAQSSAVKGHSGQRAVEQAQIKSPVVNQQQHQQALLVERQPKAAAAAQPILESSKRVYNDESIRRSAASQQQVPAEPAAKSAPVVNVAAPIEPVVPVKPDVVPVVAPAVAPASAPSAPASVSAVPGVQPSAHVPANAAVPSVPVPVASAPVAVASKEQPVVEVKKVEQVEPKSAAESSSAEKSAEPAKPVKQAEKDELPAQSMRSAPIKDEPSKVIVEQVVPAKVAEQQQAAPIPIAPVVAPVVLPVAPEQQPSAVVEQPVQPVQAPVPEIKPVVSVSQQDSPLQAKKDDQSPAAAKPEAEPASIEVPAPDPGLVLSEPIDSTTKLLIDLDEHVQKFLPAEDKQEPAAPAKEQVLVSGVDYSPQAPAASAVEHPSGKSSVPLVPYSSSAVNEQEPIVPPLPQSIDKVEKASGVQAPAVPSNTRQASSSSHQHQNQQQVITQLLDQLDSLQNRIQDTINQLVARRRYVMSALLRPMGTYVRRVRTNLERLQNRVNQLQAAAVSVGGNQNGQRPGGFVDAAAIETIRRRIDDISKRISDIVNRIRFSLTPTSAPLNNNGK